SLRTRFAPHEPALSIKVEFVPQYRGDAQKYAPVFWRSSSSESCLLVRFSTDTWCDRCVLDAL
ncbi:MAG: hypothetical protein ACI9QQ_001206, partial [Myxococcota bacterium]